MNKSVAAVFRPSYRTRMSRPLVLYRICDSFPSPAGDHVEGRTELNRDLIRHLIAT
ncbi:MAG: hypothetical protein H0T92_23900 [Pyrinomonadaceae bacterium]|nr:hypothetical protein [Pyrinomonadaceae bacterium]